MNTDISEPVLNQSSEAEEKKHILHIAILCCSLAMPFPVKPDEEALPPSTLDFTTLIPKTLPRSVIYRQDGWHMWDPCVILTDDGTYHLLYSRWRKSSGFDAWCTHAEIAWASQRVRPDRTSFVAPCCQHAA